MADAGADVLIGGASFIAGVYFADIVKKPIFAIIDWVKSAAAWIKSKFTGLDKAGAPLVLDRNAKWQPTTPSGVDAQHVETRRLQIEEICRLARVMPIMVGYSDKATTYASAEQMFLSHVVHTLGSFI